MQVEGTSEIQKQHMKNARDEIVLELMDSMTRCLKINASIFYVGNQYISMTRRARKSDKTIPCFLGEHINNPQGQRDQKGSCNVDMRNKPTIVV